MNGPGMCDDCLLSVKEELISMATGLGEEDWSCSFLAISVLVVFSTSICTCKPVMANEGRSEGKRKFNARWPLVVSYE